MTYFAILMDDPIMSSCYRRCSFLKSRLAFRYLLTTRVTASKRVVENVDVSRGQQ